MRRDIIFGLVVSTAFHGGFAGLGQWLKQVPHLVAPAVEQPVDLFRLPPPEPEEPIERTDDDPPDVEIPFIPAMQPERPTIPKPEDIVQPLTPPPRSDLRSSGLVTIPTGPLARAGKILELTDLDQVPRAVVQGRPDYPFEMRSHGVAGSVTVEFVVDAAGSVVSPFAVKSSQREFEASAVKAVSRWKFKPGIKGGQRVATRMSVEVQFELSGR